MYYSELLNSPISTYNVKRLYGVDPVASPTSARAIQLFPVVEPPDGYTAVGYRKEGTVYRAIANQFSNEELNSINTIKQAGFSLQEAAQRLEEINNVD